MPLALAQSDVGCAMGPVVEISPALSGLTFLSADPKKIMDAFDLSLVAHRTIRQNLFFAFFYNAVAIPVAVAGLLNPLVAVVAMFLSSLTVIGNALRISGNK